MSSLHVLLDCLINPCVAGVPKALCFIVIPLFLQKLSMFFFFNYFPLLHTVFFGKSFGVKVLLLGMQYIFSNFSCKRVLFALCFALVNEKLNKLNGIQAPG